MRGSAAPSRGGYDTVRPGPFVDDASDPLCAHAVVDHSFDTPPGRSEQWCRDAVCPNSKQRRGHPGTHSEQWYRDAVCTDPKQWRGHPGTHSE